MARASADTSTVLSFTVAKVMKEALSYEATEKQIPISELVRDILAEHLLSLGLIENKRDTIIERGTRAMFTHASESQQKIRKKILQKRMERARAHRQKTDTKTNRRPPIPHK